ncbi:MAG: preprotein translocase subunit SecY [Deltaproteobacteria bacterium]|nr:preprotein translocase subunit SecY [Deltaproteobacteria bacterium]MBI3391067.1 preprotein translocase subunit SecY [Deltaproteobacteria bacterium]
MLEGFQSASKIPELRKRLLFTFGMLAVYRLGVAIPTPGIDGQAMAAFFAAQRNTVFGFVNLLSGGALEQFSIFALGIMPYISASIILQLLTVVVPFLERLSKEGEVGRRKITQYTRYGTVVLSVIQSLFISIGLEKLEAPGGVGAVVFHPGWSFRLMTVITLSSGTAFIMWLGEQISERGIGNGISLIIFAGIVSALPSATATTLEFLREGELSIFLMLFLVLIMVAVVAFIILCERGQRRIPVQYAKRVVGRRMYGGQSSHLPLKVNTSGVIPPIFASSLLVFPATIAGFLETPWAQTAAEYLRPGGWFYELVYIGLIVFFCYFYTAVTFNTSDVAENMKKFGGYIPGIRPGPRTAEYIDRVLVRITLGGAMYVAAVCVLPTILVQRLNVPFYFGGTALMIVVGVALDTVAQMETHLLTRSYQGFMRGGRLRGRR